MVSTGPSGEGEHGGGSWVAGGPSRPDSVRASASSKPCPLSQKCANCLNHALRKASEINNPQAEVLLGVS